MVYYEISYGGYDAISEVVAFKYKNGVYLFELFVPYYILFNIRNLVLDTPCENLRRKFLIVITLVVKITRDAFVIRISLDIR